MNSEIQKLATYSKQLRLLYVEDNEEARRFTFELLNRFFDHIDVAQDGQEGLEKFQSSRYDLVLSDINMPNMNGIDMISQIKADSPDISVVMLTAHNETPYLLDAIELGVDSYLLKPIKLPQLIRILTKCIDKIRMQKELEEYRLHLEKKVEERTADLEYRLYHDQLTELNNYTSLQFNIERTTLNLLALIDIDGFQNFNELYGLKAGDTILKAFSELLLQFNRERSYTLYRLYSDVFAISQREDGYKPEHYQADMRELSRLIHSFSVHLDAIDARVDIDATIAVSQGDTDPYLSAEMALYHAKHEKRPLVFYDETMDTTQKLSQHLYWKGEIKKALEQDNIVPVFQAMVDNTGEVVKYESLMRLVQEKEGERKLISPYHFLDSAVKTKEYEKLTRVMIKKTFAFMQTHSVDFSVNLSFEDLSNPKFIRFFEEEVAHYGIGQRLTLEILESATVEDYELVNRVISQLRKYRILIAIDDFGSGFSNFEHILKLDPDYIKIDGSLIKEVARDKRSFALVKAITDFSKDLGIEVIAEFVSSEEIYDTLKELNIDAYQGYHFSIPSEQIP